MRPFHFVSKKRSFFKAIFHRDSKSLIIFRGICKGVGAMRVTPAISMGVPNVLSQAVVVFVSLIAEFANHRLGVQVHIFHMVWEASVCHKSLMADATNVRLFSVNKGCVVCRPCACKISVLHYNRDQKSSSIYQPPDQKVFVQARLMAAILYQKLRTPQGQFN